MGCHCTLKDHPKREQIDEMARAGVPYKVMRRRVNVGVTRLNWHTKHCLKASRNGARQDNKCAICYHEERAAIEYAMRHTDEVYRAIATRFDVSQYSLARHGLNCMHFSRVPHKMRYPDRLKNGWRIESKAIAKPTERRGVGTPRTLADDETKDETLERAGVELAEWKACDG